MKKKAELLDEVIKVRLTPEELMLLEQKAASAEMTKPNLIRHWINNMPVIQKPPITDKKVLASLTAHGESLGEIAKELAMLCGKDTKPDCIPLAEKAYTELCRTAGLVQTILSPIGERLNDSQKDKATDIRRQQSRKHFTDR